MRLQSLIVVLCALLVHGCQSPARVTDEVALHRQLTRDEAMDLYQELQRFRDDVSVTGLSESEAAQMQGLIGLIQLTLFDFTYFPGPENHMALT
jgi:hypothetical protein